MLTYYDFVNPNELRNEYPVGDAFRARFEHMSRDELRSIQEERFLKVVSLAWRTPFYRRIWSKHGIEQGAIRSLDQLSELPIIDKNDLRSSIDILPPFGDFATVIPDKNGNEMPTVFHTTSGTTGIPQPILFGPKSREVQNLLLARSLLSQGLHSKDVVQSVYGFGLVNGGHYVREAVTHYTLAKLIPSGTGLETASEQQVLTMARFGVTVLTGFGDYLRKLAEVAEGMGMVPGRDIPIRMLTGAFSRAGKSSLENAWGGIPAYDWYGVADTGAIAAEGLDRDGMVVWEDAHLVEIVDPNGGNLVRDGEIGDMVVTCLFKDDFYPIIRFNTHDMSFVTAPESYGLPFQRIAGFMGRSDNMVKVRGINVYPDAIGAAMAADDEFVGEYVCVAHRINGEVKDLEVVLEADSQSISEETYTERLRNRLGVRIQVTVVNPGATATMTELGKRQKPLRLVYRDEPGRK